MGAAAVTPGSWARAPSIAAFSAAVLLTSAFSGDLYHPFWTPKVAILALVGTPGLFLFGALVRRRDRAAMAGAWFLAAAAVSAALARVPALAFIGRPDWGSGWIIWALVMGVWAVGRFTDQGIRRATAAGIAAAAALNAFVAVLQTRDAIPIDGLAMSQADPRPFGLLGNAVHLGSLCAAGAAIAGAGVARCSRRWARRASIAALVAGSLGVEVSGGRVAVAALAVGLALGVGRAGPRRIGVAAAAVLLGLLLGAGATSGTRYASATARTAEGVASGSPHARLVVWRTAGRALLVRPVLGFGPGRVATAVTPRLREPTGEPSDRIFADAHSWPIQVLLETGVVGFAALLLFGLMSGRGMRGPWLGLVGAVGTSTLLEPMSVATLPLVFFALGATTMPVPPSTRRSQRHLTALAAVAGGLIAVVLVVGDAALRTGALDFSRARFDQAHRGLPPWPDVSLAGATVYGFFGVHDPGARRQALKLAREAAARDPEDPRPWVRLGDLEAVWGSKGRAESSFQRALTANPWSEAALTGIAALAQERNDGGTVGAACRRAARAQAEGTCAGRPLDQWR